MALTIIQMYANTIVSADAIASVDIPEDGAIVAVDWSLIKASTATWVDDDSMLVQLSFISTSQFTTNDARGSISVCGMSIGTLTTSGNAPVVAQKFCAFPEDLDVSGGERIYLHALEAGAASADIHCHIHLKTRRGSTRRSARRR